MNDDSEIRVLVVEDDADLRTLLKMNIDAHPGFCLAGEAPDGSHAAELLQLSQPDVVIMDLDMPNVDGLGAIYEIRKTQPGVKIVVFSARYDKYDANDLLEHRANLYIDKTRPVDELLGAIDELVRRGS